MVVSGLDLASQGVADRGALGVDKIQILYVDVSRKSFELIEPSGGNLVFRGRLDVLAFSAGRDLALDDFGGEVLLVDDHCELVPVPRSADISFTAGQDSGAVDQDSAVDGIAL
jgi:hypothetical protein